MVIDEEKIVRCIKCERSMSLADVGYYFCHQVGCMRFGLLTVYGKPEEAKEE